MVSMRPIVAWYDMWIGAYWDRRTYRLYILPVPCVGVVIQFRGGLRDVGRLT